MFRERNNGCFYELVEETEKFQILSIKYCRRTQDHNKIVGYDVLKKENTTDDYVWKKSYNTLESARNYVKNG